MSFKTIRKLGLGLAIFLGIGIIPVFANISQYAPAISVDPSFFENTGAYFSLGVEQSLVFNTGSDYTGGTLYNYYLSASGSFPVLFNGLTDTNLVLPSGNGSTPAFYLCYFDGTGDDMGGGYVYTSDSTGGTSLWGISESLATMFFPAYGGSWQTLDGNGVPVYTATGAIYHDNVAGSLSGTQAGTIYQVYNNGGVYDGYGYGLYNTSYSSLYWSNFEPVMMGPSYVLGPPAYVAFLPDTYVTTTGYDNRVSCEDYFGDNLFGTGGLSSAGNPITEVSTTYSSSSTGTGAYSSSATGTVCASGTTLFTLYSTGTSTYTPLDIGSYGSDCQYQTFDSGASSVFLGMDYACNVHSGFFGIGSSEYTQWSLGFSQNVVEGSGEEFDSGAFGYPLLYNTVYSDNTGSLIFPAGSSITITTNSSGSNDSAWNGTYDEYGNPQGVGNMAFDYVYLSGSSNLAFQVSYVGITNSGASYSVSDPAYYHFGQYVPVEVTRNLKITFPDTVGVTFGGIQIGTEYETYPQTQICETLTQYDINQGIGAGTGAITAASGGLNGGATATLLVPFSGNSGSAMRVLCSQITNPLLNDVCTTAEGFMNVSGISALMTFVDIVVPSTPVTAITIPTLIMPNSPNSGSGVSVSSVSTAFQPITDLGNGGAYLSWGIGPLENYCIAFFCMLMYFGFLIFSAWVLFLIPSLIIDFINMIVTNILGGIATMELKGNGNIWVIVAWIAWIGWVISLFLSVLTFLALFSPILANVKTDVLAFIGFICVSFGDYGLFVYYTNGFLATVFVGLFCWLVYYVIHEFGHIF